MYVPARDYSHHYSQSSLTNPIVRETDLTLTGSETKLYLIQTICFSHKNHSGKKLAISGDFFLLPVDILLLNGVLLNPVERPVITLHMTARNLICTFFKLMKIGFDTPICCGIKCCTIGLLI